MVTARNWIRRGLGSNARGANLRIRFLRAPHHWIPAALKPVLPDASSLTASAWRAHGADAT